MDTASTSISVRLEMRVIIIYMLGVRKNICI